ncbi:MAG: hypothetical protein IIB03_05540 [Acidobacteria bacterium]|nr:hypothetical protein [Acidobacteriota bacterium]
MKRVLFLCLHNSGRSQMAEAFLNSLANGRARVASAGTDPAGQLNPTVVQAMAELGLNLSGHAPKLITREMVASMGVGSVIVDVAVDQGGCSETTRPTTHSDPTYIVDGVVHYCVSNMPGSMPRTSTFALTNVTLPYILRIAKLGLKDAVGENPYLKDGVNIHQGNVTLEPVAQSLGLPYQELDELL